MLLKLAVFLLGLTTNKIFAQEFQCHIQGHCSGIVVGVSLASLYNSCLDNCRNNVNCHWFTHFDNSEECIEFYDCPFVDTTCTNCHSGQVECGLLEPVCNAQGFCNGHFVAVEQVDSADDCHMLCQSVDECGWYSYFPDINECLLTEDCIFFDDSCANCVSGEKECQIQSENLLFVVGGLPSSAYNKVEVVNLGEEGLSCPAPQDIPLLQYGSVATFIDDAVMICGGYDNNSFVSNKCYNYNPATDSWTETYSMLEIRVYAAAVQLSATRWWITGGAGGTTEMFTVGEGFSAYVDLPEQRSHHNLVKINSTHVILVGDASVTTQVWMFHVDTELWTELPDLLTETQSPQAGLVTHPNGSMEVVVATGYFTPAAQILNLDTLTWRYGPSFPTGNHDNGASVPYGNTFLVVGGYSDLSSQDYIYIYDVSTGSWTLLPQHLAIARMFFAAVMVPDGFIDCT